MRKPPASSRGRTVLAAVPACLFLFISLGAFGASDVRSGDRLAFALTGARVIAAPGRVFDRGIVVVRGGVIEAVGMEGSVSVPADASVYDPQRQDRSRGFRRSVPSGRPTGREETPRPVGRGRAVRGADFRRAAAVAGPGRDVLDFRYAVVAAYIDGRALDLSDKHKRLYERYKSRPKPRAK